MRGYIACRISEGVDVLQTLGAAAAGLQGVRPASAHDEIAAGIGILILLAILA